MSPLVFALVAAAGGFGAVLRYLVDLATTRRLGRGWGTFVINVTGSFLLGVVVGGASRHLWDADAAAALGTGLLGGYTTFSTAVWEAVRLVRENARPAASLAYALGMLVAGVAAAALGLALAS